MPLNPIDNTLSSKDSKNHRDLLIKRHNRLKNKIPDEDFEEKENPVENQDKFEDLFPSKSEKVEKVTKKKEIDLLDVFESETSQPSSQKSLQIPHTLNDIEVGPNTPFDLNKIQNKVDLSKYEIISHSTYNRSSILITKKIKSSHQNDDKIILKPFQDSANVSVDDDNQIKQVHVLNQTANKVIRKRKVSETPIKEEKEEEEEIALERKNINPVEITLFEEEEESSPVSKKKKHSQAKKGESDLSEIDANDSDDVYQFKEAPVKEEIKKKRTYTKRKNPVVKVEGDRIKTESASYKPVASRRKKVAKRDLIDQQEIVDKMKEQAKEFLEIKKHKLVVVKTPRDESTDENE